MKKLLSCWVMLLSFGTVLAQQAVTLRGTIDNALHNEAMLMVPNLTLPALPPEEIGIKLNEQGKFSLQLELTEPVLATFRHGREQIGLYLEPGKDVLLSLNTNKFDESLKFEGAGAAANTYLNESSVKFEDRDRIYEELKTLSTEAFVNAANARKKEKQAFLEEYKPKLPKEFYELAQLKIMCEWGSELAAYPRMHAYLNETEEVELPDNYYDFAKQIPLSVRSALSLPVYRQYMITAVRQSFANVHKEQEFNGAYVSGLYAYAGEELKGAELEYFRYKLLHDGMRYEGVDDYIESYQDYLKTGTIPEYRASLEGVYTEIAHLAAGNMAPGFTLKTLDGQELSLEDLRGKVVYIDFWASWCGPCLREMPAAKKVKEHFKDQPDVAFVYISIDDDEESWRDMVAKKEIEGLHLYSQGWRSEAAEAYVIQSIPRYVLVDRQGKIIDATMSRPSDPTTITRIEEALKRK